VVWVVKTNVIAQPLTTNKLKKKQIMLLFDLEDYATTIRRLNYECWGSSQWEDAQTTARETRNAWLKSITVWYKASTVCLVKSNPCYDSITKKWDSFMEIQQVHKELSDELFEDLINYSLAKTEQNKEKINDTCAKYRKASIDLRCTVKQLMFLVDGDTLEPYKPQ